MRASIQLMVVRLELCARPLHHPVADELHDVIAHAALPLSPSLRNVFTMQVLTRLRACPAQEIGVGLAHRLAAEPGRD